MGIYFVNRRRFGGYHNSLIDEKDVAAALEAGTAGVWAGGLYHKPLLSLVYFVYSWKDACIGGVEYPS
jgi:hypothetical protein